MIKDYGVEVALTRVMNGDKDNGRIYSRFARDPKIAKFQLDNLVDCWESEVSPMMDEIFSGKIDDELFEDITTILTFWDELMERTGFGYDISANDLYFALLVNYCAGRLQGIQPIRSYVGITTAKENAYAHGHALDYREYAIQNEGEKDFNNDYINVTVSPKGYNSEFDIKVPVKYIGPKGLGIIKVCTDGISSLLCFERDSENGQYVIPGYLWMGMMKDKMSKRNTIKFKKAEEKAVAEMFNTDDHYVGEIIEINDFRQAYVLDMTNQSLSTDFDPDSGNVVIRNVRELPPLEYNGREITDLIWWRAGGNTYVLHSHDFYLAAHRKGGISVFTND